MMDDEFPYEVQRMLGSRFAWESNARFTSETDAMAWREQAMSLWPGDSWRVVKWESSSTVVS